MKRALITGITGQDGSYLTELLLEKGYEVHGIVRSDSSDLRNIFPLSKDQISLHKADLADTKSLRAAVESAQPHEIYNFAAITHEKSCFDCPEYTANIDALGVLRLLEIIRLTSPNIKFFQASSAEVFGKPTTFPQVELTPFRPQSPYGVSKLYAHWSVVNYRETYGLFCCNGILFNHESPRRAETFVSRKITTGVARIFHGIQEKIVLGNLNSQRDWGFAKDFVVASWLMLQQEKAEDYILATGKFSSVRQFIELAFKEVGIAIEWQGKDLNEIGIDSKTGKLLIEVSPDFFRPVEVISRVGDASKAKRNLGWEPQTGLQELVKTMMKHDLETLELARQGERK